MYVDVYVNCTCISTYVYTVLTQNGLKIIHTLQNYFFYHVELLLISNGQLRPQAYNFTRTQTTHILNQFRMTEFLIVIIVM
jgi:hypothetical protein